MQIGVSCSTFTFALLLFFCKASAQMDSLVHNALTRTYLVHLPTGYTGISPLPLVIAMHGGFGSATNLQDQSLLSVKADAEHFIVVYPEGVSSVPLNIRTWNAGWCCGYASNNNMDDVGFINTLLDTLMSQFNVDTTRIYATGMSNGGFMSYRLACELSNRIAAIAPVAASMSLPNCNPVRPVPIIQFHSYLDNSVPYLGGIGSGISNHYNSPHDSVLNAWSLKNNCNIINDTIINNAQYTFVKWENCDCNVQQHYYITQDGGHSWPGGTQTPVGDPPSVFINANDLMWDFFMSHSLICDSSTSVFNPLQQNYSLSIFPNPTKSFIHINVQSIINLQIIDVTGRITEMVIDDKTNPIIFDISSYPTGIYTINVQFRDGYTATARVAKM